MVKLPRKTLCVKTNSFLVWNILTKMEKLMDNPNLWHIQVLIFDNLNCDSVMKCRRVCKSWNETLRKMSDVKFLQEFGDIGVTDGAYRDPASGKSVNHHSRMEKGGEELRR